MRVSYFGDTDLKPSIIGIPIEPPRVVAKIPLIRATIAALNLVSLISRNTTCRYGTVYIYICILNIFIYTVYLCGVHYLCLLFRPKKHRLLAAVELSSQLCTVHPFHGIMAVCLYDCTFLGLAKRV